LAEFTFVGIAEEVSVSKILIVDDDRNTIKLLRTLLEIDGFTVAVVERGKDVLPLAQEFYPDCFLLDYHLDDMNALELIQLLRSSAAFVHTPVVVVSGSNVGDEVMAAGADAFLVKPFEPAELREIFNRIAP
jgi:DNA-binding response OmpR family regulator